VTVHELSRLDARRIAVRAQLLASERPAGLLDLVRRLTLLQIDPTAAIAPNADLVARSRLGWSYSPAELEKRAERPFDTATTAAVDHEIKDVAHWLGLELMPR
jgi:uncharacterized protein